MCLSEKAVSKPSMGLKDENNNTIETIEPTVVDTVIDNGVKKKKNSLLEASFEPTSPIYAEKDKGLSFSLPSIKQGKKKHDHMETFNPIVTSKQILEDCNCVNKPNTKVKQLRRGEGKLISTGSRSIKEVYSYIFNKSQ